MEANRNKSSSPSGEPSLPEKKRRSKKYWFLKGNLKYNAHYITVALYLEDYTPIRTIEVTNLPEYVCASYLRGYFEHAGPVENVDIIRKIENNKEEAIAYVTFVIPEDAAKLICDENLRFNVRFTVKEAGPIHQPKINTNTLSLEEVNNDCILHIMSYLDLVDIVNLGKTSTRLQSVAQESYERKKYFSFNTNTSDSSINETNLPIILKEIGHSIRSIEWNDLTASHLEMLTKYCPNVKIMKFFKPSTGLSSLSFKQNKTFFAKLKRLHLHSAKLFDSSVKAIISQSKVISLTFENCRNIRGSFFTKTSTNKLKHLKIINCNTFNASYHTGGLDGITHYQRNNQLVTFSIEKCCSYLNCLTSESVSLAKLKELALDFSCFIDDHLERLKLNELKRLTKLTMTSKHSQTLKNFNKLFSAMSQIDTLESLNVTCIIDNDTINCLGAIKNLKRLRLECVRNTIGKRLYTALCSNLPNLTELSISFEVGMMEVVQGKWICDMIATLPYLRYFSLSVSTWELLNMILQVQLPRMQLPIKIGISKLLFDNPRKAQFDEANKGVIKLCIHQ